MPIYEYRCQACGHQLEIMQKISEAPATDCPECERPQLKKLISTVAFRLKGGGWYETDFKTGDKKQLADSEGKSADDKPTAEKGDETKGKEAKTKEGAEKKTGPAEPGGGKQTAPKTDNGAKTPSKPSGGGSTQTV